MMLHLLFAIILTEAFVAAASPESNSSETAKASIVWPGTVIITSDLVFPLISGGKQIGNWKITQGTVVKLLKVEGESVEVFYANASHRIPVSTTDLPAQIERAKQARMAEQAKQEKEASETREKQAKREREEEAARIAQQAAEKETTLTEYYNSVKADLARSDSLLDQLIAPSDREIYRTFKPLNQAFVAAYERGDMAKAQKLYRTHNEAFQKILLLPIIGLAYNEFVKREIEKPIEFNLFKDSNRFYIAIGDGDFRTLAPIKVEHLVDMVEALAKGRKWIAQCRREHLDVTKEIGKWSNESGHIRFELVSSQKGEVCSVWLEAKGPYGKDRLLEETKVRLTVLNTARLLKHITNASKLVRERSERLQNAEKLK